VAGMALTAQAIGGNNLIEQVGLVASKPGAQGRADIETQPGIIIDDSGDAVAMPEQARRGIRPVTLGRNARVPVMIRSRRVLHLDFIEPGVLARRLVEMTVDTDVPHGKEKYRVQDSSCRGEAHVGRQGAMIVRTITGRRSAVPTLLLSCLKFDRRRCYSRSRFRQQTISSQFRVRLREVARQGAVSWEHFCDNVPEGSVKHSV